MVYPNLLKVFGKVSILAAIPTAKFSHASLKGYDEFSKKSSGFSGIGTRFPYILRFSNSINNRIVKNG